MSITSFAFFAFCLSGFIISQSISKNATKKLFLLAISYYFYMTIDWRFAGILLLLTVVNFVAGQLIFQSNSEKVKKVSLAAAISISLGVLFYFKYLGFLTESFYAMLNAWGIEGKSPFVDVVLPIGISFMTFQSITYPLDLYSKKLDSTCNFTDFSLFMSFFPQLLSGPIVRASFFLPQLSDDAKNNNCDMMEGLTLILKGLIKKIVFADMIAVQLVDPAFSDPSSFSSLFLAFALVAYSFQVYMDLSGYTDIALGIARIFGYRLPVNFNRPYLATSIANFWQRWHITMSSFFRDYLYSAIEKNRIFNVYGNLLIVFVAIGVWHGAGLNFVVYGLIHGSLVGLEHLRKSQREKQGLPPIIYRGGRLITQVALIFAIVVITRLLFRGDDFSTTIDYLTAIHTNIGIDTNFPTQAVVLVFLAALLHFTPVSYRDKLVNQVMSLPAPVYASIFAAAVYGVVMFNQDAAGFIYFQF